MNKSTPADPLDALTAEEVGEALILALQGDYTAVDALARRRVFSWPDGAPVAALATKPAEPATWLGSIPAEESDEEFARQIEEMGHPTESAGKAVQRPAIAKERGAIIDALAKIINVPTPDKLYDLEAIPRDPVMTQVARIAEATYRLSDLAERSGPAMQTDQMNKGRAGSEPYSRPPRSR